MASTPAPSEKIALRLGRLLSTLGGGCQATAYWISDTEPMPSGQMRTSRSGARSRMALAHRPAGQVGITYSSDIARGSAALGSSKKLHSSFSAKLAAALYRTL